MCRTNAAQMQNKCRTNAERMQNIMQGGDVSNEGKTIAPEDVPIFIAQKVPYNTDAIPIL